MKRKLDLPGELVLVDFEGDDAPAAIIAVVAKSPSETARADTVALARRVAAALEALEVLKMLADQDDAVRDGHPSISHEIVRAKIDAVLAKVTEGMH